MSIKDILHPKNKMKKLDILKNMGYQTVEGPHWLQLYGKNTMEVNGVHQLFQHSSKYLLLCSTEGVQNMRVSKRTTTQLSFKAKW